MLHSKLISAAFTSHVEDARLRQQCSAKRRSSIWTLRSPYANVGSTQSGCSPRHTFPRAEYFQDKDVHTLPRMLKLWAEEETRESHRKDCRRAMTTVAKTCSLYWYYSRRGLNHGEQHSSSAPKLLKLGSGAEFLRSGRRV